ncbi:hypothetical protein CYMTET_27836 [Cymbomonas tetramitiformis]|uniref:Uncharacterized protein n=1 Tax=Cymbomonas tetramitiformis TaxID=36881 RepID=A0AAE0FPE7_9CHLO|nr:hypothetical protein CYMTET_27836 [Cymbomonas tetramitiformis]
MSAAEILHSVGLCSIEGDGAASVAPESRAVGCGIPPFSLGGKAHMLAALCIVLLCCGIVGAGAASLAGGAHCRRVPQGATDINIVDNFEPTATAMPYAGGRACFQAETLGAIDRELLPPDFQVVVAIRDEQQPTLSALAARSLHGATFYGLAVGSPWLRYGGVDSRADIFNRFLPPHQDLFYGIKLPFDTLKAAISFWEEVDCHQHGAELCPHPRLQPSGH